MTIPAQLASLHTSLLLVATSTPTPDALEGALTKCLEVIRDLEFGTTELGDLDVLVTNEAHSEFGTLAELLFDRLNDADKDACKAWIESLPLHLRPSRIDWAAWEERTGTLAHRDSYRIRVNERLDALAHEVDVADGSTPSQRLHRIEEEFDMKLPEELYEAWSEALGGAQNPLRFVARETSVMQLLEIAELVNRESIQVGAIFPDPSRRYALLPFAHGFGDRDYVTLDLSAPTDDGDFEVYVCVHEVASPGPRFPSTSDWLRFESQVAEIVDALDQHQRDQKVGKAMRRFVRESEFDPFDELCRQLIETYTVGETAFDKDAIAEAIERFWENSDPVDLKPSLPSLR